jgi:hypothetical protein
MSPDFPFPSQIFDKMDNYPKRYVRSSEDRLTTPEEFKAALARNACWIKEQIKAGKKIYDIGINEAEVIRHKNYELEKQILEKFNYPTTPHPR